MSDDNLGQVLIKSLLLTLTFVFVLFLLTIFSLGVFAYQKYNQFLTSADLTHKDFLVIVNDGWRYSLTQDSYTFLILGLDSLDNRNSSPLTDTMILASINLKTGRVNLVSLPRDLWNDKYKTKINALYAYAQQFTPEDLSKFPQETIAEMTGQEIDFTVIMSMDQLSELVHILGGVEIDVDQSFTDHEFPNPNIDPSTTNDPKLLYKTIVFDQGVQKMDSERLLEYIRSRHSESSEGTDLARANRQQQAMTALISQLQNKSIFLDPYLSGQLLKFYREQFAHQVPLEFTIALGKRVFLNKLTIDVQQHQVSNDLVSPNGVLSHPMPSLYNGSWVFVIRNQINFNNEVNSLLHSL